MSGKFLTKISMAEKEKLKINQENLIYGKFFRNSQKKGSNFRSKGSKNFIEGRNIKIYRENFSSLMSF